jgi:hypothetical protein
MSENQHTTFTGEAAMRASEMFRGSPGKRVQAPGEQSMHLKALGEFVPHVKGRISLLERELLEREAENAILRGEDPTEYVSWLASTLNDVDAQAVLNTIKDRPKPLEFYRTQIDNMILTGKDPTSYINSVSDKLNDKDKFTLFDYLDAVKLMSGIGTVGLGAIEEASDAAESNTAG